MRDKGMQNAIIMFVILIIIVILLMVAFQTGLGDVIKEYFDKRLAIMEK